MIRKLNFTGRKRVPRSKIGITVEQAEDGFFSFRADIDLAAVNLPADADVFVEAYSRSSIMRFHCGKVGAPVRPSNRLLTEFEAGALPLFRVKIVRQGRIIASADRIIPRSTEDEPRDKLSLLPVEFVDLGDLVWRLDFTNDLPLLQLNSEIDDIRETARSSKTFFSLVYPEVVRQALRYILIEENYGDAECDREDWQSRWLLFAGELPGVVRPPTADRYATKDDKEDWIEQAVMAFAKHWQTRRRFMEGIEGGVS